MRLSIGILSLLIAGSVARAEAPKATTAYYYGLVKYFAVDGSSPLGEAKTLVKRTVDPAAGRIVEIVTLGSRKPGDKPGELDTELKRVPGKNEFKVTVAGKTFGGTMKFEGPEWAWTRWTYQLKRNDGGSVTGDGSVSAAGFTTNKTMDFADRFGSVVREDLKTITEADYNKLRKEILGK